jgi:hypothetical protein
MAKMIEFDIFTPKSLNLKHILFITCLFISLFNYAQEKKSFKLAAIGFYNLENLFDTENDTIIDDEDFLPDGANAWTIEKYEEKLANMAYAISQIAMDQVSSGISVLGVSEIENEKVLLDLVNQPLLKNRNYKIIHRNSFDRRGIDVAILYNPAHFTPRKTTMLPMLFYDENGEREFTRDIMMVEGDFDGEKMAFFVNHWPSRGGGEERTQYKRNHGAKICRKAIDSLYNIDPKTKAFIMGDLNDDPTSVSIKVHLKAKSKIADVKEKDVFNPMEDLYRRGIGSLAYRDNWSLFDQIIITSPLVDKKVGGYQYLKANVFNKKFLIQSSGQYKGYPFRTFSGNTYQSGYSDHFPTYVYIVKEN